MKMKKVNNFTVIWICDVLVSYKSEGLTEWGSQTKGLCDGASEVVVTWAHDRYCLSLYFPFKVSHGLQRGNVLIVVLFNKGSC